MKTQFDFIQDHEASRPQAVWMTQPMGQNQVRDFTFAQGFDEARRMAAYLQSLGYPPGSRIAIFSKNSAWWLLADLSIWLAGYVSVPVYPTLAAKSIEAILEHSGAKLVFVGKLDGYAAMESGLPSHIKRVTTPLAPAGVKDAESWDEIVKRTAPLQGRVNRDADELATIIYTSGSTGEPKGVMHSFRTLSAPFVFESLNQMTKDDRLLSYLPLAHIAERAILETTNFKIGYHVFFAEALDTFVSDMQRARPTLFGSVPRLWLKFQAGVFTKMPAKKLETFLKIPILSGIVKKKILKGLGMDQVRWAVTGSAPTPPELVRWYASLGLKIGDIYGMTENAAVSHANNPGEGPVGSVGKPLPGVQCRIDDNGEVLMKSPGMMLGYFNNETLTKEVIDSDGWFHTGDRGAVDADGRLTITGRVKELFKTSKGKYVAPAPIENQLLARGVMEQACVSGVNLSQPYALVVLSESLRKGPMDEAARNEVTKQLELSLSQINAKLDPHEQLQKLVVMRDEWTVENGLLTPTLKVKRAAIEEKYGPHVDAWIAQKAQVLWVS